MDRKQLQINFLAGLHVHVIEENFIVRSNGLHSQSNRDNPLNYLQIKFLPNLKSVEA